MNKAEKQCALAGCERRFIPAKRSQRYCSPEHKNRDAQRRFARRTQSAGRPVSARKSTFREATLADSVRANPNPKLIVPVIKDEMLLKLAAIPPPEEDALANALATMLDQMAKEKGLNLDEPGEDEREDGSDPWK